MGFFTKGTKEIDGEKKAYLDLISKELERVFPYATIENLIQTSLRNKCVEFDITIHLIERDTKTFKIHPLFKGIIENANGTYEIDQAPKDEGDCLFIHSGTALMDASCKIQNRDMEHIDYFKQFYDYFKRKNIIGANVKKVAHVYDWKVTQDICNTLKLDELVDFPQPIKGTYKSKTLGFGFSFNETLLNK